MGRRWVGRLRDASDASGGQAPGSWSDLAFRRADARGQFWLSTHRL